MNLVIDVGNTLVKIGLFEVGDLKLKKTFPKELFTEVFRSIESEYPQIKNILVASVGKLADEEIEFLEKKTDFISLNQNTPVPYQNKYGSPQTLGVDRMALAAAAITEYPKKNVLVVDAGTCITYDLITEKGEYLGGGISPGILMRYKAVNYYTSNLPLLQPDPPKELIGNNTASSLHSGILNGARFEIDGFIDSYRKEYSNLTVILTGGDAHFLRDSIKNHIFANPIFLLKGLNYILDYNTN